MKVVLAAFHAYPSPQAVPLANGFLAAYLQTDEELSERVTITLRDFYASDPAMQSATEILSHRPAAIGFSLYLWNRQVCRETALLLKRLSPDIILFAGGPEAGADPMKILSEAPYDFVITGEGERPFVDCMARLIEKAPFTGIKGVATRSDADTEPRVPVEIPDTIPSPYLTGILPAEEGSGILWQLSRGCDFSCDYCFDASKNRGVRRFSMERVEQELRHFVKKRVSQIFVLDSTFNVEMKRAKSILRLIARLAPHIHFHFEVRSEFLDKELAQLFGSITCSVQIGLQSADPSVLKKVHRHLDPADFGKKINLFNEAGVIFGFDLIYGLPSDTLAGFQKSLDYALSLQPNHLDIFPLAILPGTALAGQAGSLRITHLAGPPYTVTGTPSFPPQDLMQASKLASACDIFYSRGKAVAWFGSVVAATKLAPAEILGLFADWMGEQGKDLDEKNLSDHQIYELQQGFMERLFARRKIGRLLPATHDLIKYHHLYAAALLAPEPELPTDRQLTRTDLLSQPFLVAPSAQLATFNYEIYDILESEPLDMDEFCACFRPGGSFAVIYPRAGEIFTESLIEPYYRLLEKQDGSTPAGRTAAALGIAAEEAASFLEFAAAEGIISFTPPQGSS